MALPKNYEVIFNLVIKGTLKSNNEKSFLPFRLTKIKKDDDIKYWNRTEN